MLNIGWSEVSITPDVPVKLRGQFYERISEYVESEITVTTMAVESDGEQMILCSCDLTGVYPNLIALVREQIANVEGLDPTKIIISATHTHTSIDYATSSKEGSSSFSSLAALRRYLPDDMLYKATAEGDSMDPHEALHFIADRIACCIRQAWESRAAAKYVNTFGRAAVGMCRRVVYDDGSAKMWGDTNTANYSHMESGNDNGIELLFTYDADNNLTGIVANIACPSQVVEQRSFISSDYWGKVKEFLRARFGEKLYVLGLCAAAGDQCPRDLIRWVEPETPIRDPNVIRKDVIPHKADPSMFDIKGCRTVGRRIAAEINAVYDEITPEELQDEAILVHKTQEVALPLRRVTIAECQAAEKAIAEFVEKNKGNTFDYADTAAMHIYAGTIARFEMQQKVDLFKFEAHFIRFGDIAIATNPFELFLEYGNQIRARSYAKQTFLIQLACGCNGYLPTAAAEQGSHYSAYVSSGYAGHQGGELLVRTTLDNINTMWNETGTSCNA